MPLFSRIKPFNVLYKKIVVLKMHLLIKNIFLPLQKLGQNNKNLTKTSKINTANNKNYLKSQKLKL